MTVPVSSWSFPEAPTAGFPDDPMTVPVSWRSAEQSAGPVYDLQVIEVLEVLGVCGDEG